MSFINRQILAESPALSDRPVVLVAEDNAEMRQFITEALSDRYRLVPCSDGAEALKEAIADPPDLVVTDLMMPKLDRLVAEMRACEPLTQVPVLVLSATSDEALRVKLLAVSVHDYVIKPFLAQELSARVRNLVMMKRSRDLLQKELASQSEDLAEQTQKLVTSRQGLQRSLQVLRTSEGRWRAIFENSAVGIVVNDPKGVFTATNRAYQEMVGYTDEELRALSSMDITYEDDRQSNSALARELWEGKIPRFQCEKRYRRKDGGLIWARTTVSLAPGTETVPPFAMAIIEDITERKRAEEQLRRSEAYLAESQRLSHLGSWAATIIPSRKLLFWSQENYRICGFDPANGTPSLQAVEGRIHPEDRPKGHEAVRGAIRERRDFVFDFRLVLPDGTTKFCHSIGHPVVNETGDVVEFTGTVMDVTESKRSEEALQRSFDQLRALTAQLQSVREEERTMVAREIHDELGQALTAIKLDVSALVRELRPDQGHAIQRSQSILKLLDETIQSVQRISTNLRPGILDDLGLAAALEWTAEEFQARTGTKCWISVSDEDTAIDTDRATALFRIFQETLTNVARHAKATEVNVRLVKENGNLILEVHDNGLGIREEQLSAGKSLGILGMRERARLLGGELTIQGVPGGGTTVRVRIPCAEPQTRGMAK